ncbi:TetR/AcrR family transcriptional regulator [Saccharibacillus alkalitolerans]|uniref:TetR/AcrR family transcriptional regulator n=1 Tax=Saccharibacillus alkalitolerans TaxID=2705290 RepID=A0ABX0FDP6_9BACL|nr:TetR/AcrR family transcriptional regulator [Saccharibacillus alkalitolerans]NGZ76482.1 TetR/AcrR family transcriptional regulator [Saccharibacillus alkalitolerans]
MSREKIKEVAILHFNRYGYEGAKMSQIAEEAGIRKQSMAYHFSSKKELLTELYGEIVEEEIAFVRRYFAESADAAWEDRLHGFLVEHKNRFLTSPNVNLMFVFSFTTPIEVHDYVLTQYRRYLAALKEEATALFSAAAVGSLPPEACTVAYVTMLDGLDVQLVYETKHAYEQTLSIVWNLFLTGIRHAERS